MARVLQRLGSRHVLVVHAKDGLDEISIAAPTRITEFREGWFRTYTVAPEQFGLKRAPLTHILADGPQASLGMILELFAGKPGPGRDIVAMNAGAAIYAAGLAASLGAGAERARQVLDEGSARLKLNALVKLSRSMKKPVAGSERVLACAEKSESTVRAPANRGRNTPDMLRTILLHKTEEVTRRKSRISLSDLEAQIEKCSPPRGFYRALKGKVDRGLTRLQRFSLIFPGF